MYITLYCEWKNLKIDLINKSYKMTVNSLLSIFFSLLQMSHILYMCQLFLLEK